jgi:tetratricopeptide (TPR) repeat protein
MIVVSEINAHGAEFLAVTAEGYAGQHTDLIKGAVVAVVVKKIRASIVRQEQIRPAVIVVIGPDCAQTKAMLGIVHSRFFGDILKGAIAAIVKQVVEAIAIGLDHLGNLRAARQDYPGAAQLLQKAVAADPDDPDPAVDLAITELYSGDMPKAEKDAKAVLQRNPDHSRALALRGKIDFLQGNYQAAADELHAALGLTTDFDIAYNLALADLELKKTSLATVLFDEMKNSLPETARLHVLIGRAFLATSYPQLAAREFERASTLDPKYPDVHYYLGLASVLSAQAPDVSSNESQSLIAKAETSLQQAVRLQPQDARASLYLAQCSASEQQWAKAADSYRSVIKLTPAAQQMDTAMTGAYDGLAEALRKLDKNEEAAVESAKAQGIRAKPQRDGASAAGSDAAKATGDSNQQELHSMMLRPGDSEPHAANAEAAYTKSVSLLLGQAYHNLAAIDARASRYAQATEEFSEAAKWDPSVPRLDRNWGVAAFRAEKYEEAAAPLERELRRTPNDLSIREMLGLCYYMGDKFAESAATLRPVVDQLSDNAGLLYAAGVSLVRSGDAKNGARVFSRMLEKDQNVPAVHLVLGQAYAQEQSYPEALAEFARALQLDPHIAEAHYASGIVALKQGKLDSSADQFQQELSVNPGYIPAQYQLGYVRLQMHQTDAAIPLLQDVVSRQPNHSDAHYELGKALLEQGKVKDAIQDLETSIHLHPTDYAYYQLSLAYRREGRASDADQAMVMYQKFRPKPHLPRQ